MARRTKRKSGWHAARGAAGSGEGGEGRRFVGALLAIAAVMVLMPTCRVLYWWLEKDHYVIAQVEVVSAGASRTPKTVRVRELATGTELSIEPLEFGELTSDGTIAGSVATQGMRFTSWFNPAARATLGIVLFDQRLVSRARHPELATGATVAGYTVVLAALVAMAVVLMAAPRRGRG